MFRLLLPFILLLLIVGGAYWLSTIDASKPTTRVEKIIPDNAIGG